MNQQAWNQKDKTAFYTLQQEKTTIMKELDKKVNYWNWKVEEVTIYKNKGEILEAAIRFLTTGGAARCSFDINNPNFSLSSLFPK